jgi:hypothetical protein
MSEPVTYPTDADREKAREWTRNFIPGGLGDNEWEDCYLAGLAAARAETEGLRRDRDEHRRKWTEYERQYILPCFDLATKCGYDLRQMVTDNPGQNCVMLLVNKLTADRDALRGRVAELEAEGQLMLGNWTNVKARDRFQAVLLAAPAADPAPEAR